MGGKVKRLMHFSKYICEKHNVKGVAIFVFDLERFLPLYNVCLFCFVHCYSVWQSVFQRVEFTHTAPPFCTNSAEHTNNPRKNNEKITIITQCAQKVCICTSGNFNFIFVTFFQWLLVSVVFVPEVM